MLLLCVQVFMVGACSDGCTFAAVQPRAVEVAAAVCNAVLSLGSWEPLQQVIISRVVICVSRTNLTSSLGAHQDGWALQREAAG
jgi:hypothetical protein